MDRIWNSSVPLAVILFLWVAGIASWLPGPGLAVRVLVGANMTVPTTHYLNVSDFYLVMQPDCNAILYNRSLPLRWTNDSANTQSYSESYYEPLIACSPVMQLDGNFVMYGTFGNVTDKSSYITSSVFSSSTQTQNDNSTFAYLLLSGDGAYGYYDYNSRPMNNFTPFVPYAPPNLTAPSPAPASSSGGSGGGTPPYITYPFPPDLAWKPEKPLDGFPYMPAEYFISEGSNLQTVVQPGENQFVLTLGTDCNLQFKVSLANGSASVVWETGTSSSEVRSCQLMLQQDGRLQLLDNATGVVYWNTTATGNVSVGWVLRLSSSRNLGQLTIEDIENSNNVLSAIYPNQIIPGYKSAILAIVVGVAVGVFVLAVAVIGLLVYSCARTSVLDPAEKAFLQRLEETGGHPQTRYTEAKLKLATNNFGNRVGSGGFGDVFYGRLPDGQEIAAKVLSAESHQSKQEFFNEIELLSVVHHKYLVSLLGYRCTRKQQVLVYEYLSGGDLRQRLQGEGAAENPLSWTQRTSIALQVAEGLEYLHDKCSPNIIHRDVKSTNILLTEKLVAKVADFGLSKLRSRDQEDATHVTTVVKGTPGYLDPEYHETGLLTEKSDVYAFGIVLMEIFTGRHQMFIAQTVAEAWKLQQFDDLLDPNLGVEHDREELISLVELALWCSRKSSGERPFMRQVVQRLRDLGFAPPEPSQPDIELGDESQHIPPFNIDFQSPDDITSDILPFNDSSSSSTLSSEVKYPGGQYRRRSSLDRSRH